MNERVVVGDASEKGLIKFCQSIRDVNATRDSYPVFHYEQDGKGVECLIPFNSEIKFNLYIRDMMRDQANPERKEDNLMVILKGAPEKVLQRCSKILINDKEEDYTEYWKKQIKESNEAFANQGERVLAFARFPLEPSLYPKHPPY